MNAGQLQDGVEYRVPDGRVFRAKADARRRGKGPAWSLIPTTMLDVPVLHMLDHVLLVEDRRIIFFEFCADQLRVQDTGWTVDDLLVHREAV